MKQGTNIALAPMAGITDSAFRLMNVLGGADLVYSEMAHVNAIGHKSKKTFEMLKTSPFEFPYIVQFFGKDPQYFARAAKIISEQGVPVMRYEPFDDKQIGFIENLLGRFAACGSRFVAFNNFHSRFQNFQKQLDNANYGLQTADYIIPSGLDINFGCPAKKVFGHGGGAALWKDLKNVRIILEEVLKNTKLPVSIKVRTAVGNVTLFDLLDRIKDLPIESVMIHGRTYAQGFSGPIDTGIIKQVTKKYPQFEIWANGGIMDTASANKVIRKTGCKNLGIARGAYGNPLLAGEIKNSGKAVGSGLRSEREKSAITEKKGSGCKLRPTLELSSPYKGEMPESARAEEFDIAANCVLAYIHSILNHQSKNRHGIVEMRKHLAWYFQGFPGAKEWRKKLVRAEKIQDTESNLYSICQQAIQ